MHQARHSLILNLGAIALAAGALLASPPAMAGGLRVNTVTCARPCRQVVVIVARQNPTFDLRHRGLQRSQQIASAARRQAGVIEQDVSDDVAGVDEVDVVFVPQGRSHFRHCR